MEMVHPNAKKQKRIETFQGVVYETEKGKSPTTTLENMDGVSFFQNPKVETHQENHPDEMMMSKGVTAEVDPPTSTSTTSLRSTPVIACVPWSLVSLPHYHAQALEDVQLHFPIQGASVQTVYQSVLTACETLECLPCLVSRAVPWTVTMTGDVYGSELIFDLAMYMAPVSLSSSTLLPNAPVSTRDEDHENTHAPLSNRVPSSTLTTSAMKTDLETPDTASSPSHVQMMLCCQYKSGHEAEVRRVCQALERQLFLMSARVSPTHLLQRAFEEEEEMETKDKVELYAGALHLTTPDLMQLLSNLCVVSSGPETCALAQHLARLLSVPANVFLLTTSHLSELWIKTLTCLLRSSHVPTVTVGLYLVAQVSSSLWYRHINPSLAMMQVMSTLPSRTTDELEATTYAKWHARAMIALLPPTCEAP